MNTYIKIDEEILTKLSEEKYGKLLYKRDEDFWEFKTTNGIFGKSLKLGDLNKFSGSSFSSISTGTVEDFRNLANDAKEFADFMGEFEHMSLDEYFEKYEN